ncbi:hypothetical protein [Desulfogranum marinum]|uniref:hypothetical protein n=1 Tax=Desulfogranum marinum TaxID=453220 RepID=UPI001965CBDD|nr:hypothetical protein [Desulfogranum marinum]MBM9512731.1 hypothetical protein [Desulfogranum marinum]
MLTCQRYIELNLVRADMVEHPGEYRWSSYRANADGETMELLTPHPQYIELGKIATDRQHAYIKPYSDRLCLWIGGYISG